MNKNIIEHYVRISQNHNKRLLLNVGGQIITGIVLDLGNTDYTNSHKVNEIVLERIKQSEDFSSHVMILQDAQIFYNHDNYIDYDILSVSIESINFITIKE